MAPINVYQFLLSARGNVITVCRDSSKSTSLSLSFEYLLSVIDFYQTKKSN